jgi:hypothetical protein
VQVTQAYYHYPTRRLSVSVESCRADVEPEVAETSRAVTITVAATGGGSTQEDCSDRADLRLARRLGGRRVVDGATGRRVPVIVLG